MKAANDNKTVWNKAELKDFYAKHDDTRRESDKERLSQVFNLSAKSPALKEALDWAKELDIDIVVDRQTVGAGGYYWAGTGVVAIGISSFRTEAGLAGVVTHEIRHAWQDYHGLIATADYKFVDYNIKTALIEADATAHQMVAEREIQVAGLQASLERQRAGLPPEMLAKREEYIREKAAPLADKDSLLRDGFEGWYKSWLPGVYGETAARKFGSLHKLPGVTPRNYNFEFEPKHVPVTTGIDDRKTRQFAQLGDGFNGEKTYLDAAERKKLAPKILSRKLSAKFFRAIRHKPVQLVRDIRRAETALKKKKGKPTLQLAYT